jgi:hypothetical protein
LILASRLDRKKIHLHKGVQGLAAGLCNICIDWVDPGRQNLARKALERLKGLPEQPEDILADPPVIIARNVTLESGEKVKGFLERNGIAVTLERCTMSPSAAPGTKPHWRRLSQDILVQQISTHLAFQVPELVSEAIRNGVTSFSTNAWKAGLGLVLGGALGWMLGVLFGLFYPLNGTDLLEPASPTTVYLYMVGVNGLCGAALGWVISLKKGVRGAVVGNDSVLELVDATVGNICRFLESNGLTPEGRKQFLSSLQGRISEERLRIREAVQDGLNQAPMMRGTSQRISGKILDAACRVPEMILLNMDMTPGEGRGQKTMLVEGFFSKLDQLFGTAVDTAFSKPITLLVVLAGILTALPFALLIVQTAMG